jgi:selenide,water dikinase
VFRKGGARPGDLLVLGKPLGTGLVLAGGTDADRAAATAGMRRLNRSAAEALVSLGACVHAVTDVTGYGLAGHGWEMAERSAAHLRIDTAALPAYPGARHAAASGVRTGGDPRNRDYVAGRLLSSADPAGEALCMDPQTSGGLLAAVAPAAVGDLDGFTVIGEVGDGPARLTLR